MPRCLCSLSPRLDLTVGHPHDVCTVMVLCSNNTITVSLALTVSFKATDVATITISGLASAAGPAASTIPVQHVSGQNVLGSSAAWSKSAGTLQLIVSSDWSRGTVSVFAFTLVNPASEQSAASLSIAANWGGTYSIAFAAMDSDTVNATAQTATVAGDAAPLKVYNPTFILR